MEIRNEKNRMPSTTITISTTISASHRVFLPLPRRSANGAQILLARPALRNPATSDMNDAAKAMILIADLLLEEDESVAITGVELVLDAGSMTFQHAAQLNPNTIKKATVVMQVCVSV